MIAMMKNMGLVWALEKKEKVVEFPNVKTQVTKEDLGFFEG